MPSPIQATQFSSCFPLNVQVVGIKVTNDFTFLPLHWLEATMASFSGAQ